MSLQNSPDNHFSMPELCRWQIQHIEEAIQAADAGQFIEHSVLKQQWQQKRADLLAQTH